MSTMKSDAKSAVDIINGKVKGSSLDEVKAVNARARKEKRDAYASYAERLYDIYKGRSLEYLNDLKNRRPLEYQNLCVYGVMKRLKEEAKLRNDHDGTKDANDSYTYDEIICAHFIMKQDSLRKRPEHTIDEIIASIRNGEISDDTCEAAREYEYYRHYESRRILANEILAGRYRMKAGSIEKALQIEWYQESKFFERRPSEVAELIDNILPVIKSIKEKEES